MKQYNTLLLPRQIYEVDKMKQQDIRRLLVDNARSLSRIGEVGQGLRGNYKQLLTSNKIPPSSRLIDILAFIGSYSTFATEVDLSVK